MDIVSSLYSYEKKIRMAWVKKEQKAIVTSTIYVFIYGIVVWSSSMI